MTRVLVIGSSHVAAYKNAADAFCAAHPQVELAFFGVRGPLFLTGTTDKKGVFTPGYRDAAEKKAVTQVNGRASVETGGVDHLLLVGHRFAFVQIASLLEHHDVIEGMRTGRADLISETLLSEVIESTTRAAVSEAVAGFENARAPLTFAPAPYPAESVIERGEGYELARVMAAFWARPDAAWVFDLAMTALKSEMARRGHHFLDQPDRLNAGPFATKATFAQRAAAMDSGVLAKTDHRHMNADYGLAMLEHFAQTRLGPSARISPRTDTTTTHKERIA